MPRLDAETLLATILEGIGMPFYAVDKDWRIYIYNGHAARHFGRTAEQMIGTTVWENFPQDLNAERGRILQNAMSRRETVSGETMSLVGRYVSYVMFPIGDGLGIVFRDVTDRRNAEKQREDAEEALRKRTAELEAVLETIPTAVWFTTDRELRHVVGNLRAIELLRLPREVDLSSALNQPTGFEVFRNGVELPPSERPLHRAGRAHRLAARGRGLHHRHAALGDPGRPTLTGRRALVVEDEVLVGMLIEEMLHKLGYKIAALSTHLDQAVELARTASFDIALLDINLNGRQSFPVADVVRARGLPFLFATGYGSRILPDPYRDAPVLQKPFSLADLKGALQRAGL